METQPAVRTRPPVTAAGKNSISRTVTPVGRFLAELGGMCAVMCVGGIILTFASFEAASWLGYPNLARQAPELSVLIIAVCLSVPMAAYMAVRGHRRRHNLEMTGSTIGVAIVVAVLLWFGVFPASGQPNWHSLFGLVCGPACLLMVVEMLISFHMYSGRAAEHGSDTRKQPGVVGGDTR
jgi:hypothetical protein